MAKHTSETPATPFLKAHRVPFTEHPYECLEHGGAQHSAQVVGWDPFTVVKTLVMQDHDARPLVVLMHGNRKVSTKSLVRHMGVTSVQPFTPEVANWHSGYLVGLDPAVCVALLGAKPVQCALAESLQQRRPNPTKIGAPVWMHFAPFYPSWPPWRRICWGRCRLR